MKQLKIIQGKLKIQNFEIQTASHLTQHFQLTACQAFVEELQQRLVRLQIFVQHGIGEKALRAGSDVQREDALVRAGVFPHRRVERNDVFRRVHNAVPTAHRVETSQQTFLSHKGHIVAVPVDKLSEGKEKL